MLNRMAQELVAMGSGQHLGQSGIHESESFRWSGVDEPDGPDRASRPDRADGATDGPGDRSTSARQASIRATISSHREVLVLFTGHLRSSGPFLLDRVSSIDPTADLTLMPR
jgi:hypothetical protein